MKDTTYNGAFMRTGMTKTLTPEDIRDLLTGFIAAIELDQIRVDALPPEKFHRWYSDSMWRNWRRDHIDYINRLLPSVKTIPSALLEELAWLAIAYEPTVVRETLLDLFVGIDAPQHDLSYVTLESVAVDETPGSVATANVRDNSRLQRCGDLRACRGPDEYLEILSLLARRDERGPSPRQ